MNRILACLSTAAFFAAAATAQCGNFTSPGTLLGQGDDTLFVAQPLGFTFTMAGSAGTTTWTHVRVSTNGVAMLTDAAGTLTNSPTGTSYGSIAAATAGSLYGPAGSNPRLAPFWGDLDSTGAGNGVFFSTVPGVSAKITWNNVVEWNTAPQKTFAVEIFANGNIEFSYGAGMQVVGGTKYVGISSANGTAVPAASNFTPGPVVSAGGAQHQLFTAGQFDMAINVLQFVPAGAGWVETVTCAVNAASHTNYGAGCYNISDSFYQLSADAAIASAALQGQSVVLTPAGGGYLATFGGGTYVAPTGGALNVFAAPTDDGEASITPTLPFPTASGPQASLRVHSNGLVSWGAAAQTFNGGNNYTPIAANFLNAGNAGVWAWHDWAEQDTGSGRIKWEEAAGVVYVTWDNVDNYPTGVANNGTMQFQFNLSSGAVTMVWVTVDTNTTSTFGSAHLVGWSPAGASTNAGSIDLATALPLVTSASNIAAISLSAAPAPVSTAGSGTVVTYTQSNIPEAAPASGVYIGVTIISLTQDLAGTDLTFFGMPGCRLYVGSLDLLNSYVGATNSLTTTFAVPAGVPYGFQFYATSAALIAPNSLPNGQNAAGFVTSNGVASFVSSF